MLYFFNFLSFVCCLSVLVSLLCGQLCDTMINLLCLFLPQALLQDNHYKCVLSNHSNCWMFEWNGHAARRVFLHLWVLSTILSFPSISALETLLTDLLSPLSGFCGVLPTPSPIHFSHTHPPPHPFPFLSLPPPSFPSKLLAFVLLDPADLYCHCILPTVFTCGILVILLENAPDCLLGQWRKKRPCARENVKRFFVQGPCTLCSFWTWTSTFACMNEFVCDVILCTVCKYVASY